MAIFNTIMSTPAKKRIVRIPRETRTQMEKDLGLKIPTTIYRKDISRLFKRAQLIAA